MRSYRLSAIVIALAVFCRDDAAAEEPRSTVQPKLDHYGDPLPNGAVMRLGTVRFRVGPAQRGLAFLPDGKTIAALSDDSSILFFDANTGKRLKQLRSDDGSLILSYAISPNGKRIVTVGAIREDKNYPSRGILRVWDAATLKEIRAIRWTGNEIPNRIFLTAGGKIAITGDRTAIRLWDLEGTEELPSHPFDDFQGLAISPDGTTIAIANYHGKFEIWEWKTNRARSIALRDIWSLDISPDGKTLAIGIDSSGGGMILFDLATGKSTHTLPYERTRGAREAAFTGDSKYVMVPDQRQRAKSDRSGKLLFFDVKSGLLEKELRCTGPGVRALTLSANGKCLAAMTGPRLRIWDAVTWKEITTDDDGHYSAIEEIAIPTERQVITVSFDGMVQMRGLTDGRRLSQFPIHERFRSASVALDGKRLAVVGDDDDITVWDLSDGKRLFQLPGHGQFGRTTVSITADGKRFLSFGHDFFLRVTDLSTGKAVLEHAIRPQGIQLPEAEAAGRMDRLTMQFGPSAFSPDGSRFVWNIGASFFVFDVATGKELLKVGSPSVHPLSSLAFSPDGSQFVATGWARPVTRFLPNGEPRTAFEDTAIGVWNFENGENVFSIKLPELNVGGPTFSPNGRVIATIAPLTKRVILLAANDGRTLQEIDLPSMPGWKIAFTPDGKKIACVMTDGTVLFFDVVLRKGKVAP